MPLLGTSLPQHDLLARNGTVIAVIEREELTLASDGARELVGDSANTLAALREALVSAARGEAARTRAEIGLVDGAGLMRRIEFEISYETAEDGPRILAIGHDVTARWAREAELGRRVVTDALTGLPNRVLLADRIGQALLAAERARTSAALIVLDLDHFKDVNDTHGHAAGDILLRQLGERARAELRGSDTVARLGGDEFAILVPPPADIVSALATARKIHRALAEPFTIGGVLAQTSASLGIALYPQHAGTADTLLDRADAAMYAAKRTGTSIAVYDPEHDMRSSRVLAQLAEIGNAITSGELDLEYQPTVRLRDGRAMRAEALVRWVHSSRGRLRPAAFLALAERGGLGPALCAWVLHHAVQRCRVWREAGTDAGVSINVGLRDVLDADLPRRISSELAASGLEPRLLTLDLNEQVLTDEGSRLDGPIRELAKTGVRLALDDFGSGSASLSQLRRLPLSEVKLDRRFVSDVCTKVESWTFVRTGIDIAHDLGLEVVAEGVEDQATAYVLERLGCDVAQGHYFTKSGNRPEFGFLRPGELDTAALN